MVDIQPLNDVTCMNNPTIRDMTLAKKLAMIAQAHYREIRETETAQDFLSDKMAQAMVDFRRERKTPLDKLGVIRQDIQMNQWKNNRIQFPRLIAEANAAGAFSKRVMRDMATSMGLTVAEVQELVDRAEAKFEEIKGQ